MKESKLKDLSKEQLEDYISQGLSFREIGNLYRVSVRTARRRAKFLGINTKIYDSDRNKCFDIHAFDSIDTEEKAYWLGFLYADGCVISKSNTVQLALMYSDYDHVLKFKKFMKDTRDNDVVKKTLVKTNNKYHELAMYQIRSKHLKQTLIQLGCVPRKSLILKFPDMKIFKDFNLVYDFIRGYVDGDGSLTTYSRSRFIISILGTIDFLSGVQKIFPQFLNINKHAKDNKVYDIRCSCKKADYVSYKLYGHATVYLDRKFKKFATLCRLYNASEKSNNIGEGCDANTEITSEITKGPEES